MEFGLGFYVRNEKVRDSVLSLIKKHNVKILDESIIPEIIEMKSIFYRNDNEAKENSFNYFWYEFSNKFSDDDVVPVWYVLDNDKIEMYNMSDFLNHAGVIRDYEIYFDDEVPVDRFDANYFVLPVEFGSWYGLVEDLKKSGEAYVDACLIFVFKNDFEAIDTMGITLVTSRRLETKTSNGYNVVLYDVKVA